MNSPSDQQPFHAQPQPGPGPNPAQPGLAPLQPGRGAMAPRGGSADPLQKLALVLFACAALLLIGVVTKGWASATEGRTEISAGMFGFEGCSRGKCESLDWEPGAKRLDIPGDVDTFRILGMIGGFAAIGLLGFAGFLTISRTPEKIPFKVMQGGLGFAAFCLTYFAFRLAMSDRDVNFGPSYSPVLAIGALIGAGVVLKKLRGSYGGYPQASYALTGTPQAGYPQTPQAGHPQAPHGHPQAPHGQAGHPQAPYPVAAQQSPQSAPQPPPQSYPCTSCGQALVWVAEHQRWYCPPCQNYV